MAREADKLKFLIEEICDLEGREGMTPLNWQEQVIVLAQRIREECLSPAGETPPFEGTRPLPATAGGVTALDLAWERINALGGSVPNAHAGCEEAFNDAIGQAVEIIEALGGSDPNPKRTHWLRHQDETAAP